jgi:tRNA dimethylallyltransferase
MNDPPAIFLLGPTAAGKSDLALALAERFNAEIISIDSALIYRGMDVGTAKPDAAMRARVAHHLIDIVEPTQRYSAGQFRRAALAAMQQISSRARVPLLVGGTMMYYKVLTEGLHELPQADARVREEIEARAAREGWPALHAELARLDPPSAQRLQPADAQRIQRALEVCYLTGTPWSAWLQQRQAAPLPYRLLRYALVPSDRALLHQRIAQRFDAMLRAGLVEELAALRERHDLSAALPSMRCVGYRQAWQFLEGEYDSATLREKGIAATRQLAKRQLTWLRSLPEITSFDCFQDAVLEQISAATDRVLVEPGAARA